MIRLLLRRTVLFASIAAIIMSGSPLHVMALTEAQQRQLYVDYELNYYSALSADAQRQSCGGTATVGKTNMHKIWNFLIEKGLSDQQAAGVMGNILVESGRSFSPFVQEIGRTWPQWGYGLVQWTDPVRGGVLRPERRTALVNYMKGVIPTDIFQKYYSSAYGTAQTYEDKGYIPDGVPEDVNDMFLSAQLNYLYDEAQVRKVGGPEVAKIIQHVGKTEWEALKSATSIKEASDIWMISFERPKTVTESTRSARAKEGSEIYAKLVGDGVGLNAGGGCITNANTDSFTRYVLDYAHPEYHRPVYMEKRPAYAAAVQKAQSERRFVGGLRNPGIDCGGFVTLLMYDSGFEPRYNLNGRGGNTAIQQRWVSENWTQLNRLGNPIDPAVLQPGDVAFIPGHTYVYVGDIPGFNSKIASASLNERAPMAGNEPLDYMRRNGTRYVVMWYRKG